MTNGIHQSRTIRIAIMGMVLAALPACSANAGFKRKSKSGSPSVVAAPPSGRIAYRPPGYSWWNRPKQFYLQGYAGANYGLQARTTLRETRYQRSAEGHAGHGH